MIHAEHSVQSKARFDNAGKVKKMQPSLKWHRETNIPRSKPCDSNKTTYSDIYQPLAVIK